ncbi:MAG: hypothetical protein AABY64_14410 [Bdellovibrionota bacterium]
MKPFKQSVMLTFFCIFVFTNAQANSSSAKLELLKKVRSVIIPDLNHGDESFLKEQAEILKEIKTADQEFECLFLEVEPKATIAINNFLTGLNYEDSVRLWINETSHKIGSPFKNIIPDWYLLKIHKLGFKIVGVDIDWNSELGSKIIPLIKLHDQGSSIEQYGKLLVGERSKIIAENVIRELQNKSCRKGVLIVGQGHLEDFLYKPVQLYFKDANVSGFIW